MPTNPPQKKKRIRKALRKNWTGILGASIVAAIVAVVLITDDDPPGTCPIEDVVQEAIDPKQELHEHSEKAEKVGPTHLTCSFQTSAGANEKAVQVEIFTHNNDDGPKIQIQGSGTGLPTPNDPFINRERSTLRTEDGGYWLVQLIPSGPDQVQQKTTRVYLKDNLLCAVIITQPYRGENPDALDVLRTGADRVATTACTPTTG